LEAPFKKKKGCFICEVAGAFDVLIDGPGGLSIDEGWWKKDDEAFQYQLDTYCKFCGAPVPHEPVEITEDVEEVSISNIKNLEKCQSPKLKQNRVIIVDRQYDNRSIKKMTENWKPWEHFGEKGRGKHVLLRYGLVDSLTLIRKLYKQNRKKRINRKLDGALSLLKKK